jgi:hypothetical protein
VGGLDFGWVGSMVVLYLTLIVLSRMTELSTATEVSSVTEISTARHRKDGYKTPQQSLASFISLVIIPFSILGPFRKSILKKTREELPIAIRLPC